MSAGSPALAPLILALVGMLAGRALVGRAFLARAARRRPPRPEPTPPVD